MVDQIRGLRTDIRVVEHTHDLVRLRFDPSAVLVVAALLRDLANVDLRIEVGGECFAVIAGITVDDVEVMDLVEVVLGGPGSEDARHAGVETATQYGQQALFAEAVLIGPLPAIFELSLVFGLIIRRIEVIDPRLQASVHDSQVLIRQSHMDDQFGLEGTDQLRQFGHVVGIYLRGLDLPVAGSLLGVGGNHVAFGLGPAGQHDLREDLRMHGAFEGNDPAYSTGADNEHFRHGQNCLLVYWFLSFLASQM